MSNFNYYKLFYKNSINHVFIYYYYIRIEILMRNNKYKLKKII